MSRLHSRAGVKTLRRRGRERRGGGEPPRQVLAAAWRGGGGERSPAGCTRFGFLSGSPPPSPGAREPAGRAGLPPPGSPTLTPRKGAPGPRRAAPPFLLPGRLGEAPLLLPLLKMAAPASEVGGDRIRRPLLALPFFPPRPFLLRLDAPPHPQAGGARMGGEWPDRVEPIQLYCSTRDTSSAARPPASPAG